MSSEFKYTISEKVFIQKPLVLGQLAALSGIIDGLSLAGGSSTSLISALGDKLPKALACVLVPEGVKPKEVNLEELEDIFYYCDTMTAIQVIEDFFVCNPIALILEKISGKIEKLVPQTNQEKAL